LPPSTVDGHRAKLLPIVDLFLLQLWSSLLVHCSRKDENNSDAQTWRNKLKALEKIYDFGTKELKASSVFFLRGSVITLPVFFGRDTGQFFQLFF
jgi:hypothetical protein